MSNTLAKIAGGVLLAGSLLFTPILKDNSYLENKVLSTTNQAYAGEFYPEGARQERKEDKGKYILKEIENFDEESFRKRFLRRWTELDIIYKFSMKKYTYGPIKFATKRMYMEDFGTPQELEIKRNAHIFLSIEENIDGESRNIFIGFQTPDNALIKIDPPNFIGEKEEENPLQLYFQAIRACAKKENWDLKKSKAIICDSQQLDVLHSEKYFKFVELRNYVEKKIGHGWGNSQEEFNEVYKKFDLEELIPR